MVRLKKTKEPAILRDHVRELTRRLIVVALVAIIASSVAYNYQQEIVGWLLAPLGNQQLMYITPGGGFNFIFQVTMNIGIACAIPVAFYNLFRFISPALPRNIRHISATMAIASLCFMIAGVAFGYYIAIPGAMKFLTTIAADYINASLTADSYLSFVLTYTIGLSILFQLPLVFLLIHWVKPLKPKTLLKGERWAVVGAFVVAALITPTPDVVNQLLVATPLIVMYQMGVTLVAISVYREKRRLRKAHRVTTGRVTPTVHTKQSTINSRKGFVAYQQAKRGTAPVALISPQAAPPRLKVAEDTLLLEPTEPLGTVPIISISPETPATTRTVLDGIKMAPSSSVIPRHHERANPLANYAEQRLQIQASRPAVRSLTTSGAQVFSIDGIRPRRIIRE